MDNIAISKRSPYLFFILVYALSIPLWVINVFYPLKLPVDNLPLTDVLATFAPVVAASILTYREEGLSGVKSLLKRAFDYKRIRNKAWYIPIIFLMPFIYLLTYIIMHLVGLPVPTVWNPPLLTPLLFIALFLAAAGEELGYSGYATDPMQARYTALNASLIIGLIHAVWHFPSMYSMGMSLGLFIWGGFILAISFRILTVWLYNNTGKSVFAAILFHAVTTTGRSIFPGSRSTFQLYDGAIGYGLIAIAALIVVFLWGQRRWRGSDMAENRREGCWQKYLLFMKDRRTVRISSPYLSGYVWKGLIRRDYWLPIHRSLRSTTARAFSVSTILIALCLLLLKMTTGSPIFLASAIILWPWIESPTSRPFI